MAVNLNGLRSYSYVYFIGIGGIGMSALARWFSRQGIRVFGYDRATTELTELLIQEGMVIHFEDQVAAIPHEILQNKDKSLVVYTPAIPSHQAILSYLNANNYAVCKRAAVLGMITQRYFTVAIAGTHGKTTASSLMAHVLYRAEKSMTAFLGGMVKGYDSNLVIWGKADKDMIAVIEADEFDRFFLQLHPDVAIVTTVDLDHLDTYGDAQELEVSFCDFVHNLPKQGHAIVHQEAAKKLLTIRYHPRMVQYALAGAAIRAENIHINKGHCCFDYVNEEVVIQDIHLPIPGYHNVENALAVITACLFIGLAPEAIRQGIATFQGVKRRFDYIIQQEDLIFLDDYSHHPVELAALLRTVRQIYPGKKITAVFRPHLYSRTRDFAHGFAQSLSLADRIFLLAIYPAREEPIEGVTSALIFDQMELEQKYLCTEDDLIDRLAEHGKPEVLINIGAGGTSHLIQPIKDFLLHS